MIHLVSALRPEQWIKNLFVLLPFIFSKRLFVYPSNMKSFAAFALFCAATSAAYLINDVIDIEEDKRHPVKRSRAVASGKLAKRHALAAAVILALLSLCGSWAMDPRVGLIVLAYLGLNIAYSFWLKHEVIIDVFCIGAFFVLRIIAGSAAAGAVMSHWVVLLTVLLALFLGFNKRRQELGLLKEGAPAHRPALLKYDEYFIDLMITVIASSIVVVYMLYTVDSRTVREFGNQHLAYTIPFVYYGIFRYLYLIHKKNQDGDPTRVLLSDWKMQINLALWVCACIAVIYYGW